MNKKRKRCGNCRWYTRGGPISKKLPRHGCCWSWIILAKKGKLLTGKYLDTGVISVHPNYAPCDDWEPEPRK